MSAVTHFLIQHGYVLLLAWVFVEQIGYPCQRPRFSLLRVLSPARAT